MVFTKDDGIPIIVSTHSARKLLEEFPDKNLPCSALDRLLWQIDIIGSTDRKSGSSRECTVCTRDVQMATTFSTNCNRWYGVRTAKATFPPWKLLFLSSVFSERKLKLYVIIRLSVCLSVVCNVRAPYSGD